MVKELLVMLEVVVVLEVVSIEVLVVVVVVVVVEDIWMNGIPAYPPYLPLVGKVVALCSSLS